MTPVRRFEEARLLRVRKGTDLWVAIEAAQFGRLVDQAPPKGERQRQAIARFLRHFADGVEAWEKLAPTAQGEVLGKLGRDLDELALHGLHVHAGTIEREAPGRERQPRLPIALLTLSRESAATVTVRVPLDLAFGD